MKGSELFFQLSLHWDRQLRPRLSGLEDEEYLWEPVPNCWTIRENSPGVFAIDRGPAPEPPPVTTIAWRLAHITFGCLAFRANWHFGDRSLTWETARIPGTAAAALEALDAAYGEWRDGVLRAPEEFFSARSVNTPGSNDGEYPFGHVVLHINREVIHHGAEVALLRDLYLRRGEIS